MNGKFSDNRKGIFLKGSSRKNFILSIVAIVEVIAIIAVATFAWVETISSIKIFGSGEFEDALYTKVKIGTGSGYQSSVDLSKFFRESGGIHLASGSSANGTDVYFPITRTTHNAANVKPYRKCSVNDKNVNYYNFSFKVEAATSNCDFYFLSFPDIKINNVSVPAIDDNASADEQAAIRKLRNAVRLAITVDGVTNIFSMDNIQEQVIASLTGATATTTVHSFSSYLSGLENTSPLFSLTKNQVKTVRITMWLQDTEQSDEFAGIDVSLSNLVIGAGMSMVTFKDFTSQYNAQGSVTWKRTLQNSSMFVWDGAKCYPMTLNNDDEWQAMVLTSVIEDSNKTLYFCRCADTETSIDNQNDTDIIEKWSAPVSSLISTHSTVYHAYGAAQSGTWGDVVCLNFGSDLAAGDTTLTIPAAGSEHNATHVKVTNAGGTVESQMNFYYNSDSEPLWRAYMPISEASSVKFVVAGTTVNAGARGASTEYYLTSSSTGYWAPPATVLVDYADGFDATCGTISVTGGVTGSQEVQVTKGTTVQLQATALAGYRFVGWSLSADDTSDASDRPSTSQTVTAPNSEEPVTYYAVFIRQYTIQLKSVTDGEETDGSGGKVQINSTTPGTSVSQTYDEGTSVTITAAANEGYAFDGFFTGATDGQAVSVLTFNLNADITYYGRFHSEPVPSKYALRGGFCAGTGDDQWSSDNAITMYYVNNTTSSNKVFAYVDIDSTKLNSDLEFKITYTNSGTTTWYTNNNQTVTVNAAESNFNSTDTNHKNAHITFTQAGRYVFVYNLSGTKKLAVYSLVSTTAPTEHLLQNCLVFKTSTETKSVWLWLSGETGTIHNVSHTYSGGSGTTPIGVYDLPDTTNDYYGIGYKVDASSNRTDNDKTTYDIAPDNNITYGDRVFYNDQDKVSDAKWKAFTHINASLASDNNHPKASSLVKLSMTTSTTSTLKTDAIFNYYVRKGTDVYLIGTADTTSDVYWVPCEAGTYEVFATVEDKWKTETRIVDEITYVVH